MPKWKTPRPLISPLEVDKRKRPNQLYAPHVLNLNEFVEKIRESKHGDKTVPWFDPAGAGVNARVLLLLQDPSNTAIDGTGFVSPDNPDKTADNTTNFRNKANLHPEELVHWNIVPWKIGERKADDEIKKAIPHLIKLINLLPKLEVVVCMGASATDGWNCAYPDNPCIRGWNPIINSPNKPIIAFTCPHPSGQSLNGYHPLVDGLSATERIEITLDNARKVLDKDKQTR